MAEWKKRAWELPFLFAVGGSVYYGLETLWRGYSHWTMFCVGGFAFMAVGLINEVFPWELGFLWQMLIGGGLITALELAAGIVLNLWLGLGIWDYSNLPLNLWGQICLPFSLLWVGLSAVAIVVDDLIRWKVFGEEKPHYRFL